MKREAVRPVTPPRPEAYAVRFTFIGFSPNPDRRVMRLPYAHRGAVSQIGLPTHASSRASGWKAKLVM